MPVLQYTALLLETADVKKLTQARPLLEAALTREELSHEDTVFQFVWHPSAPGLTLVTVFENGMLGSDGYELWGSNLGKKIAKAARIRTWELHLCGGTVFNQCVWAYDRNGEQRWRSEFDGQLPDKVAMKQEDPFVPLAEATALAEKTLKTLGVGRIEGDAGAAINVFVEVEQADPSAGAKATSIKIGDDWTKALTSWNRGRSSKPQRAPHGVKTAAAEVAKPEPFEIAVCWSSTAPDVEHEALLFLHDVARAEKLEPASFQVMRHRVAQKGTMLRMVPDPGRLKVNARQLFASRVARLGELGQAAFVIDMAYPFITDAVFGTLSGRMNLGGPHFGSQLQRAVGFSAQDVYATRPSPEQTNAYFEQGKELFVGEKPLRLKQWKQMLAPKTDAGRERVARELLGLPDLKWGPFTEQLHAATASLECTAPAETQSLATRDVEARVGVKRIAALRKQWKDAAKARVERGPMMSVQFSSF